MQYKAAPCPPSTRRHQLFEIKINPQVTAFNSVFCQLNSAVVIYIFRKLQLLLNPLSEQLESYGSKRQGLFCDKLFYLHVN